jgi:TolB-like protein
MRKLKYLVLGSLVLLGAVYGQEKIKIAVIDIQAKSGIDEMTVSTLTDVLCTAMSQYPEFQIVARDDIKAMLGHMQDQQVLDCDDTACLVKIGDALGVLLLVAGNIGKVGEMYVINLKLINIEKAEVQNRISEKYQGSETGLVKKIEECGGILLAKKESTGKVDKERRGVRGALSQVAQVGTGREKGGMGPALASCCLDPRLGYEMNEGKKVHLYDVLGLFAVLRLVPAIDWGMGRGGACGCCLALTISKRAGRDFRKTRLRGKEILFFIPVLQWYPIIAVPLEAMSGKTWSEVVEEEGLTR